MGTARRTQSGLCLAQFIFAAPGTFLPVPRLPALTLPRPGVSLDADEVPHRQCGIRSQCCLRLAEDRAMQKFLARLFVVSWAAFLTWHGRAGSRAGLSVEADPAGDSLACRRNRGPSRAFDRRSTRQSARAAGDHRQSSGSRWHDRRLCGSKVTCRWLYDPARIEHRPGHCARGAPAICRTNRCATLPRSSFWERVIWCWWPILPCRRETRRNLLPG